MRSSDSLRMVSITSLVQNQVGGLLEDETRETQMRVEWVVVLLIASRVHLGRVRVQEL